MWSGVFYTYILPHYGHLCSNYLHHLRFLCLLSLFINDNVILKAATVCGCVFSSFNYVVLSYIWIYMIACMHIHIASIFYNFKSFIFMKGAYLCLVLFLFFFKSTFSNISRATSALLCVMFTWNIFFSFLDFQYLWIFVENTSLYICILVWFYYQNIIRRLTSKDKIIIYCHKKKTLNVLLPVRLKCLYFFLK